MKSFEERSQEMLRLAQQLQPKVSQQLPVLKRLYLWAFLGQAFYVLATLSAWGLVLYRAHDWPEPLLCVLALAPVVLQLMSRWAMGRLRTRLLQDSSCPLFRRLAP